MGLSLIQRKILSQQVNNNNSLKKALMTLLIRSPLPKEGHQLTVLAHTKILNQQKLIKPPISNLLRMIYLKSNLLLNSKNQLVI
jgi:hypothetical protein